MNTFGKKMKSKSKRVFCGILIAFTVLFFGYNILWYWAVGYTFIDPLPKGEGSYEELDSLFSQFQSFYRTGDTKELPEGFVRLTGFESEDKDAKETWMIYYATASHSFKRGGTIVLLGSDGQIDGYFGHHCRRNTDGGTVLLSPQASSYWSGGTYFNGLVEVRDVFGHSFKHQKTEYAPKSKPEDEEMKPNNAQMATPRKPAN